MEKRIYPFGHPDDEPLQSSVKEIEEFQDDNIVWQDMRHTIEDRIELLKKQLLEAKDLPEVRGIQYAIKEAQHILDLPNRLIHELKTLQEEEHE